MDDLPVDRCGKPSLAELAKDVGDLVADLGDLFLGGVEADLTEETLFQFGSKTVDAAGQVVELVAEIIDLLL